MPVENRGGILVKRWRAMAFSAAGMVLLCAVMLRAQQAPVSVQVEVVQRGQPAGKMAAADKRKPGDFSNVAVWLVPLDSDAPPAAASARRARELVQRNKMFEPHVLVVQVGTEVEFPNEDPFLHNVFSLFNGKRFDLGFYEAGSSRSVRFDRAGVSFLFCNIHPDMSALVVAVETPYFVLSDGSGRVAIANVPDGRYRLHAWYERSLAPDLEALNRTVTISDSSRSLEPLVVPENPNFTLAHKNKYGQNYVPSAGKPY